MRYPTLLAVFLTVPLLAAQPDSQLYFPCQNDACPSNRFAIGEDGIANGLAQFAEPSLYRSQARRSEYRFTWFRAFHHPVVIRIEERADGKWGVVVKVAKGKSGFDLGKLRLIRNETRAANSSEVQRLLMDFDRSSEFWGMPVYIDDAGSDGAMWLIEARSKDRYHYVSRWSPESGAIREIGLRFIAVAGLDVEHVY
jgi:hypothetical protein